MLNLLQKLDYLSPPISLYFNDKRTHTSKISGLIVIIMILGSFSYSFLLLFGVINHSNVISLIYKQFESEAGFYAMNTKQLFHFFQIYSSEDGGYFDKFDLKYIRIYITYVHNNIEQSQLHNYDHWVFGECREGIDNKDISKDLFENIVNFTNSACIRYYFNSEEQKYYSLEEEDFIWPHLEHGISRRDNVFLTSLIEKCSNDSILTTLLGDCASSESIEEYIQRYFGFYMYLFDTSIDPTNYSYPLQNYFQIISTGIGNSKTFVENYIHFAPVRMRTKIGEIFTEYHEINSLFFDFNRKGTAESFNRVLLKSYYLMQNNINIYERRYKGVFDILSSIGGTTQLLFYACSIINYIYNGYIIIMDTNHFFCQIEKASQTDANNNDNIDKGINKNGYKEKNKKIFRKRLSFNSNIQNLINNKLKDNKSEGYSKKNFVQFSKFKDKDLIKKNNFFRNSMKEVFKKNEVAKSMNSSNKYNESLDFSNKPMNNLNREKPLDSIDILKEKNISSTQNNELISYTNDTPKNLKKVKKIKINNNNNINGPPKRQRTVQFILNKKEQDHKTIKRRSISHTITGNFSFKSNNFDEMIKTQKLNKEMIDKSEYFEKEFTFYNYIKYSCLRKKKREDSFHNLYALISFRKKIVSENFIFHQHIINLLLGKKCGINPNEIKNII